MLLYFVVELGRRAQFTFLCYPEGIVVVARVNLEGEGTAVHWGVVVLDLKLEYQVTLGLILL